jgi:ADP-ribose pyrophosphatase YjhB (NUDIX family)
VVRDVQRLLLHVWRRVPSIVRRWIVRTAAPSFTVGGACVVERDDGSILLVRLVYREGWGLPGGLIKRGEEVDDCARREVAEEVGLEVELTSAPAVVVDSRPQRVDVVFRARPGPGIDPDSAAPRSVEIREVGWFAPDDLPRLQHETVTALAALASSVAVPTGDAGSATTLRRAAQAAGTQRAERSARAARRSAAS